MGVACAGVAVGGAWRVTKSGRAGGHPLDRRLRVAKFALALQHRQCGVMVEDRDARRVIAPILEPLQSLKQNRAGCLMADVAHDATHVEPRVYPAAGVVQLRPLERGFGCGCLLAVPSRALPSAIDSKSSESV